MKMDYTIFITLFGTLVILIGFVFNVPKLLWSYYRLCKLVKPIPGWPAHWLYGNIHQKKEKLLSYPDEYCRWIYDNRFPVSKEWLGPFIVQINVNHPDIVNQLLNAPKARWIYRVIELWLGEGLLLSEGKRWARNRRLLTRAFHFDILKPYIQTYNECTDILIGKWMKHATSGRQVLVHADISKLTLDILLRCSFSYTSHCQQEGESLPYIEAVQSLSDLSISRYFSIFLSMLNDTVYLNVTPSGRKYKKLLKIVHQHAEKVIKERRETLGLDGKINVSKTEEVLAIAKRNHKYLDFLDILLTARDEEGHGLTDLEIRYEVDTFMFEGHDTTAHGLSWTLYCLAKHPEHQEKCREEVNQVLGSRSHLEYEDLSKLTYIQWCIKESLRLYPPVYSVYKQFNEDTKIGDYVIPKECLIAQKNYVIHHHPDFWENPYVFNPLRFHPENSKDRHPYAYIPFSAGPRNCIGQSFAKNEERLVIASIVKKFQLTLVKEHKVVMVTKVLLTMQNDIKLWLEPII